MEMRVGSSERSTLQSSPANPLSHRHSPVGTTTNIDVKYWLNHTGQILVKSHWSNIG